MRNRRKRPGQLQYRSKVVSVAGLLLLPLAVCAPRVSLAQNHQLEVWTHFGAGLSGTITIEPGHYMLSSGFHYYYFPAGTPCAVLARAPAGARFNGWFNCSGTYLTGNAAYSFTLNADRCVQAYFVSSPGPYTLTVYKGAPGLANGSISGTAGFYCGPDAGSASQGNFANGTIVMLTNTPSPGWSFAYWETNGVILSNRGPLRIIMDRDQLVQAIFVPSNTPPTVNIVSATNTVFVSVCSKTPVTVTASDSDGSITNVQLFVNDVLVAQTPTSPLTFTITNEALLITNVCVARAFDDAGASSTSTLVHYVVRSPGSNHLQVLGVVSTNAFEFCLCGLTNRVYAVQVSTNLARPWSAWRTVTNGPSGVTAIIDQGTITNRPLRFYRAGLATSLARLSDSISSSKPTPGGIVTISGTITNGPCSGISVNAGAFHVGFYGLASSVSELATQAPFFEEPIAACPANGTVDFTVNILISAETPPGTYYLGYSINDLNEVPDCDVQNIGTIWYWTLTVQ